ncbi:hypothetical protein GPECTOR_12g521 [Gonium pectorale]|uniref:polynucleotide adenylyltransferase n=1 Tax=Gonium pectorale TaxID=33097 RepID=A0A150GP93_GONPE|nr:hypothetical protein GPECTOR_12g521 [Gonium pectorale]|eukprot:KXZ51558.1 hypothetical protein GPECTOR_12g521 [Gonium pectorale]
MAGANLEEVYLLKPLNESAPTAEDKRHSQELEAFLRSSGLYESLDEALLREEVLGLFYQLVQSWVKGVCRKKNFNQTPDVAEMQPVPDAFVPMIGIKYKGVQLDVLYAPLAMHTLPEQLDLSNHAVLRGCDEPTVRSLNGCRVTDTILRLVPRQDVFRLALRAVKHWAALRGIASNVTGYLGGVNLAIMVAKICQLYPRAEASTVLLKFFILLKAWPWPRAIHLRVPEDHSMGLPVWDPRPGTRDSLALMPVITPAYPSMNSLYNVQRSTLEVMTAEFANAAEVCTSFMRCLNGQPIEWSRLFAPVPFFTQHTFYIQLEVSADGEHDLVLWDGWVSSRIRRLVRNLEDHVRVRPYPKAQRAPSGPKSVEPERPRLLYYIGIDKRQAAAVTASQLLPNGQLAALPPHAPGAAATVPAGKVDLKQPCLIFVNEVTAWPAKRAGMELRVNVLKKAQLPPWLTQPKEEMLPAAQQEAAADTGAERPAVKLEALPPPADGSAAVAAGPQQLGDQTGGAPCTLFCLS